MTSRSVKMDEGRPHAPPGDSRAAIRILGAGPAGSAAAIAALSESAAVRLFEKVDVPAPQGFAGSSFPPASPESWKLGRVAGFPGTSAGAHPQMCSPPRPACQAMTLAECAYGLSPLSARRWLLFDRGVPSRCGGRSRSGRGPTSGSRTCKETARRP